MTDVTVRGAGIFGLAVAWACLSRGARVRVIDPAGPGAGASGGLVGALAPHVPETWNPKKAFQLDSLLMAEDFWAEVAQVSGRDPGYARTGRVQPLPPDDAEALARAEERSSGAAALWQGRATWQVTADTGGWQVPGPLIRDTLSARLHPRQATLALAAAIRRRGGEIATEGPDRGAVVWATGWQGLVELGAALDAPVGGGVKGQAATFALEVASRPQLYIDGLHVVPHDDGTVAVGSTSERVFDDPATTDGALDDIVARVRGLAPDLAAAPVTARWAGVRPRARSRAPMLGRWPGRPGHFIANGGFKIGFGMAPKVGEVMAALMLDGHDEIPEGFRVGDNLR